MGRAGRGPATRGRPRRPLSGGASGGTGRAGGGCLLTCGTLDWWTRVEGRKGNRSGRSGGCRHCATARSLHTTPRLCSAHCLALHAPAAPGRPGNAPGPGHCRQGARVQVRSRRGSARAKLSPRPSCALTPRVQAGRHARPESAQYAAHVPQVSSQLNMRKGRRGGGTWEGRGVRVVTTAQTFPPRATHRHNPTHPTPSPSTTHPTPLPAWVAPPSPRASMPATSATTRSATPAAASGWARDGHAAQSRAALSARRLASRSMEVIGIGTQPRFSSPADRPARPGWRRGNRSRGAAPRLSGSPRRIPAGVRCRPWPGRSGGRRRGRRGGQPPA